MTQQARQPFMIPDGKSIGYPDQGRLECQLYDAGGRAHVNSPDAKYVRCEQMVRRVLGEEL